jgi:hypothetical protein
VPPKQVGDDPTPAAAPPLRIVVAGDVTIDWLSDPAMEWLAPREGQGPPPSRRQNWQLHRGIRMTARPGGALLLAREVALACRAVPGGVEVRSHHLAGIESIPPEQVLHSVVEVAACLKHAPGDKGPRVFRVSRGLGFSGPFAGAPPPLPIVDDDQDAGIVVLDDAGNGFRDDESVWPLALRAEGQSPVIVMKMSRPLSGGPLFDRVRARADGRAVLVVTADDLRAEGVHISRHLSWERTARDFLWQMRSNPDLALLAALPALVVRFGVDGAVQYTGPAERGAARLYYDPAVPEDGFQDSCPGAMIGLTDAFIAALVGRIAREGMPGVGEGVRDGLRSARRFWRAGFGADPAALEYPGAEVFGPAAENEAPIADTAVPPSEVPDDADPDFWCLLHDVQRTGLEPLARQLVLEGEAAALRNVPVGEFGNLRTVDRAEIESYRSVRNLIRLYLHRRETKRPLCLAVFGPPGSGKSFGVEQVAASVARVSEARVETLELNLSQYESTRDLVAALHRVRNKVLRGIVPLVFFDEFDSTFGQPLGWLRYFLAPMQDGTFRDGETMHPIGKAIFVFAGGLSPTFAHFAREVFPDDLPEADRPAARRAFQQAKGPDFVSRLRGHVNVLGPNPDPARPGDPLHLVRRATILRSLLRRLWPGLSDPGVPGRLRVDEGVLRALIGISEYKHGVRSMEAIVETSQLENRTEFEPSALPPQDQLHQHVDAEEFSRLVLQGVRFAAIREVIAQAVHERFRADRARDKPPDDPSIQPWERLLETFRRANRGQADDILHKLEAVGCGYRPRRGEGPVRFRFRADEIERLAELEHERWMRERQDEGYTWGPVKDGERKTHPHLVPWADLEDPIRQYDRDAVIAIPDVLAQAGYEVYRL